MNNLDTLVELAKKGDMENLQELINNLANSSDLNVLSEKLKAQYNKDNIQIVHGDGEDFLNPHSKLKDIFKVEGNIERTIGIDYDKINHQINRIFNTDTNKIEYSNGNCYNIFEYPNGNYDIIYQVDDINGIITMEVCYSYMGTSSLLYKVRGHYNKNSMISFKKTFIDLINKLYMVGNNHIKSIQKDFEKYIAKVTDNIIDSLPNEEICDLGEYIN